MDSNQPSKVAVWKELFETHLPAYRFDRLLGKGSTSTVFLATQTALGRFVVVKWLDPEKEKAARTITKQFIREAAMWSHLHHENLLQLYDYQVNPRGHFIVTEYCPGFELREILHRHPKLSPLFVASILDQILSGLEYLHQFSIIHRDLKPENIIITAQGSAKIVDFGIAHCPELDEPSDGTIMGTPAYMSPEQSKGDPLSIQSDFFSLGVLAHEMLSGARPFQGDSLELLLSNIQEGYPNKLPQHVPAPLKHFVKTALKKAPQKRFPRAEAGRFVVQKYLRRKRKTLTSENIRASLIKFGLAEKADTLFPKDLLTRLSNQSPLQDVYNAMVTREHRIPPKWTFPKWVFTPLLLTVILLTWFHPDINLMAQLQDLWQWLFSTFRFF